MEFTFFRKFIFYILQFLLTKTEKVKTVFCLGIILFSKFSICLIISAILLLVAMVGAICLTNEKRGYYVRQQHDQLIRLSTISVSFFIN